MEKQFLSRAETCEFLGISEWTLKALESTPGALPAPVTISKTRKYDRDQLREFFINRAEKEPA